MIKLKKDESIWEGFKCNRSFTDVEINEENVDYINEVNFITDNFLLWGADDNIVFPSEKDGWLHLYSLNIQNGNTHLLTPGDGEV